MLYFWNSDDLLIPNMMKDTLPWSSCSCQSPWLPCSGHTTSSTGPSVSPFRDFLRPWPLTTFADIQVTCLQTGEPIRQKIFGLKLNCFIYHLFLAFVHCVIKNMWPIKVLRCSQNCFVELQASFHIKVTKINKAMPVILLWPDVQFVQGVPKNVI